MAARAGLQWPRCRERQSEKTNKWVNLDQTSIRLLPCGDVGWCPTGTPGEAWGDSRSSWTCTLACSAVAVVGALSWKARRESLDLERAVFETRDTTHVRRDSTNFELRTWLVIVFGRKGNNVELGLLFFVRKRNLVSRGHGTLARWSS